MDPVTVIAILAAHLICSGGLFALIGRHMPPGHAVRDWAAGGMLFGLAYVGRLALPLDATGLPQLLLDSAMIGAALLLHRGVRKHVGRRSASARTLLLLLLVQLGCWGLAVWWGGAAGRLAWLTVLLGAVYGLMAWEAASAARRQAAELRPPLWLMAGLLAVLALLCQLRGADIALRGVIAARQGWFVPLFYAYSALAAILLSLVLLWMVFLRMQLQLLELATRDALTQLLNRSGLQQALVRHFAARRPQPLTPLLVDIDHFKRVNDQHGHEAGDQVLRAVAQALAQHLRGSDFVARVGGEEFLVCSVETSAAEAQALGQRLLAAMRVLQVPLDGGASVRCTVSVGIGPACAQIAGWAAAQQAADRALYAAKSAGRDRAVVAATLAPA